MGLYDGFNATGSNVTDRGALAAWAYAVSKAADSRVATNDALTLAKAVGEPLSSPLGQWMIQVSATAEAGGGSGVGIFDALRRAQVSLSSPFGKWAATLSQRLST